MYLRLDRALATPEWTDHYKDMRVHHLVDSTSDYCAFLVADSIAMQHPRKRRFHFEAMWTRREECREIIKAAWGEGMGLETLNDIVARLKNCADDILRWNKAVFGQVPKKIQSKKNALNNLVLRDRHGSLGSEINDLMDSKEIM